MYSVITKELVKNTSFSESVLLKKHNMINYHAVREAVAAGIMRVAKEDGETNLADLLTKSLNLPKWKRLLGCMTYGEEMMEEMLERKMHV